MQMNSECSTIYRYLVDQLLGGRLAPGDRLPTEVELGERFHTSRMNAHFAIKRLEQHGIVARKKRVGTEIVRDISPALARELKGEANRRVCVVHRSDEYFGHIHWNEATLAGLEPALTGKHIEICYRDASEVLCRETLAQWMESIANEGFSGIVLLMANLPVDQVFVENQDVLYQYFKNIYAYLRDSSQVALFPFHTVSVSNFHEGAEAAEYVYEKGIREILFYGMAPGHHSWQEERIRGVKAALRRLSDGACAAREIYGLPVALEAVQGCGEHCGIIAANDRAAAELIDHLAASGLERGRAYHLISFDDDSSFSAYNLTTIAPPLRQVGEELGRLICESVDARGSRRICNVQIHSELKERDF